MQKWHAVYTGTTNSDPLLLPVLEPNADGPGWTETKASIDELEGEAIHKKLSTLLRQTKYARNKNGCQHLRRVFYPRLSVEDKRKANSIIANMMNTLAMADALIRSARLLPYDLSALKAAYQLITRFCREQKFSMAERDILFWTIRSLAAKKKVVSIYHTVDNRTVLA